jgi:hypothetical protein
MSDEEKSEIVDDIINEEQQKILKENRKYLPDKILKYHDIIQELLKLDDFNLKDKALASSSIHHTLLTSLYSEQEVLNRLELKLEQKEEEYIKKHGLENKPKYKSNKVIENEKELIKLRRSIDNQSKVVRYLNESVKIMSQYGFSVKNAVEMVKLEN